VNQKGPSAAGAPHSNLRKHARSSVSFAVSVSDAANRVSGMIVFDTQDISAGGAFIRSDLLFEIGEELAVGFTLPSGSEITARAKVVRVSRDGDDGSAPGMGIQFLQLSESDRDAILALVQRGSHG
jgi:Tfp pilus assembly protein PilZ